MLHTEDGFASSPAESTKRRQVPRKPRAVRRGAKRELSTVANRPNALIDRIAGGWSAIRKCALSSALFMRVEVPLALEGGAPYPKAGVIPRWPKKGEGMETSKRARRRKSDTAKADLEPLLAVLWRAGCPS